MHVALSCLPAVTRTRATASDNKTTENRAVERVGEESNVEADVDETGYGTAETCTGGCSQRGVEIC